MNLKLVVTAAALVLGMVPALADDQLNIDLSSGSASFIGTGTLLAGGDDVISFANLAAGSYDFIFTLSTQSIDSLSASVNGQFALVTPISSIVKFASLESTGDSPFSLLLQGTPLNGLAKYSGELTVTLVPEPGTYALLLAGLCAVTFIARRRRPL